MQLSRVLRALAICALALGGVGVARAQSTPGDGTSTGGIGIADGASASTSAGSGADAGSGSGSDTAGAGDGTGTGSGSGSDGDDLLDDIGAGSGSGTDSASDDSGSGNPSTGAVRVGIYGDSDRTTVIRTLAELAHSWHTWSLNSSVGIDAVTSASVDVRSSPALSKPDVITSASGRSSTSVGKMTDRRIEGTLGTGWNDGTGHEVDLSATGAAERDYRSVNGALKGSYDILGRSTTLLGGVTYTDNWISSVLDPTLHQRMHAYGWSIGVARVLTPDDALRLHYDGDDAEGYQASPYRSVRFGDWTTSLGAGDQIVFANTIGSADGLPEKLPPSRVSHALVLEEVHALGGHVGLHPQLRVAHESWGIDSLTASLDLRAALATWRLQLGYRYYTQTAASFYQSKYTMDPSMYPYYTSDKELGDESGHMLTLDISGVLREPESDHQSRLLVDARIAGMMYSYPNFVLLSSRTGVFAQVGLTWEH